MIDLIKQKISGLQSSEEKLNKTREFLQIVLLKVIFDRQYFDRIAFVGGTALRIIYGMRRFSEDLDFSLIKKDNYVFSFLIKAIEYEFKHLGLDIETAPKENAVVHSSMIKFPGLLNNLGLSSIKAQKLSIKLEIDTNPPDGWNTELSPISETYVFAVRHFDLPSLFAGKLHACFFRKYTKGRDFYDLVWYLGKKVKPNYILLNKAICQTAKKDYAVSSENVREFIFKKLENIDFMVVKNDVERFVEDKGELRLLDAGLIKQLVAASQSF